MGQVSRGLKFDFYVRLADTIFGRWPGGHGDGSWKSRGRDRSIRARLLGLCLARSPLPPLLSLILARSCPGALSLSLPLSLVSPLRTRDLFLRLQFQGNPLSRPSSTPLSARENTHARTRDTRKRSKSFLLSKRNSKAAAEEKGVKKLEGKWQSERRWEWRRGKVAWKKKDYVESTQEAKGENENVSRNSQGTCSETSLKDVLLRVQHLCVYLRPKCFRDSTRAYLSSTIFTGSTFLSIHARAHDTHPHNKHRKHLFSFSFRETRHSLFPYFFSLPLSTLLFLFLLPKTLFHVFARETEQRATY